MNITRRMVRKCNDNTEWFNVGTMWIYAAAAAWARGDRGRFVGPRRGPEWGGVREGQNMHFVNKTLIRSVYFLKKGST